MLLCPPPTELTPPASRIAQSGAIALPPLAPLEHHHHHAASSAGRMTPLVAEDQPRREILARKATARASRQLQRNKGNTRTGRRRPIPHPDTHCYPTTTAARTRTMREHPPPIAAENCLLWLAWLPLPLFDLPPENTTRRNTAADHCAARWLLATSSERLKLHTQDMAQRGTSHSQPWDCSETNASPASNKGARCSARARTEHMR